jgi:hypothetical protein
MHRDVEKTAAKQKKFDFVEKTARGSMIRQHFGHLVKTDTLEEKWLLSNNLTGFVVLRLLKINKDVVWYLLSNLT